MLLSDTVEQAAEEMGLQADELQQVLEAQAPDAKGSLSTATLQGALQAWLRQKAAQILPKRPSPAPAFQLPTAEDGTRPYDSSNHEQNGEAGSEAIQAQHASAEPGAGLGQLGQPEQSAEGAADDMQVDGQPLMDPQRAELLTAGMGPEQAANERQQDSLAAVAANAVPAAAQETSEARATDSKADLSEPPLKKGLQGEACATSSEAEALPGAESALAPPAPSGSFAEAPAHASQQSLATLAEANTQSEAQPAPESGLGELATSEQPTSFAPAATMALKPSLPQSETAGPAFSCLPCAVAPLTPAQGAQLPTWAAWQEALRAAPAAAQAAAADDETMHPYTRRLLGCRPPQYVLQPEREDNDRCTAASAQQHPVELLHTSVKPSLGQDNTVASRFLP